MMEPVTEKTETARTLHMQVPRVYLAVLFHMMMRQLQAVYLSQARKQVEKMKQRRITLCP